MTAGDLLRNLKRDEFRAKKGFSDDIVLANAALHYPYATHAELAKAMNLWLQGQGNQPCLFGRVAVKYEGIDYCFLSNRDLLDGDDKIAAKIGEMKTVWKRRALLGGRKHGFMVVVTSPEVAFAAPDEHLKRFSEHIEELAGWNRRPDEKNYIADEFLYLTHPVTKEIRKFVFSVDYFAAAGDRRWWHDHRIPCGIAFTANSLGHMVRHAEWYRGLPDQVELGLRMAMLTIAQAADTDHGPATWLLDQGRLGLKQAESSVRGDGGN